MYFSWKNAKRSNSRLFSNQSHLAPNSYPLCLNYCAIRSKFGTPREEHGVFQESSVDPTRTLHREKVATDAFGEVEFPRSKRVCKYVRIESETNENIIRELLFGTKGWRLKKPPLVISVTGGARAFVMEKTIMRRFQQGIAKVVQSTGK